MQSKQPAMCKVTDAATMEPLVASDSVHATGDSPATEPIPAAVEVDQASDTTLPLDTDELDDCPPTQRVEDDAIRILPSSHVIDLQADDGSDAKITCPSCGKNLTFFNEEAQIHHVNACLDAIQQFERNKRDAELQAALAASVAADPTPEIPVETCKVCGVSFADKLPSQRIQHTKQCAKKYGVSLQALLQAEVHVDEARIDAALASLPPPTNAFDLMMNRPKPAAKSAAKPMPHGSNAFDLLMRGAQTSAIVAKSAKPALKRKANMFGKKPKYSCPDYKKIQGTSIIVDGFQYASPSLSTTYVLSHFHSDHYGGLGRSFSAGIIYCTPTTARLVQLCLGVDKKYLHPLPLHQPYVLADHKAQMTFIDANHCPGPRSSCFSSSRAKHSSTPATFATTRACCSIATCRRSQTQTSAWTACTLTPRTATHSTATRRRQLRSPRPSVLSTSIIMTVHSSWSGHTRSERSGSSWTWLPTWTARCLSNVPSCHCSRALSGPRPSSGASRPSRRPPICTSCP
ncbi:hypothetical protein SPRG_08518 [Saprolegnia parasitica CBS 223.65]|uniref:Metallo-beta-lactamase domain-containing protein n=1 Tax=Saprolegnia parasitica (strain CBS 223.65) TaxID=695850 RepID=A0A067CH84_SAPPC|nr:hypothetical protein SPRG_08518 [Saprolegnia parasitica CBS 223.65]KDO26157.1 hypothetical protein SPRG_08518 [Saprolegnia parasitica CBS 223.65]|eukprot:XP_012203151.1 hypothetical protein SPRG_08518 [Saprolegnia parasitica CBS 223.65]